MTSTNAHPKTPRVRWRVFHWTIAAAFFIMIITGLIIYTPALSGLAAGAWTRLIHRIGAVILIGAPIIYAFVNPAAARQWLREAAIWNRNPVDAPYVLNRWKRRHKLLISAGYLLFAITGMIQWFLKGMVPSSAFNVSLFIHDILFFLAILVVLYHVYFEFYWWQWKRKYCAACSYAPCAESCTVGAITSGRDGTVLRNAQTCNNCRLCMELCQRKAFYKKAGSLPARTRQS